jgi:hypothetical protein
MCTLVPDCFAYCSHYVGDDLDHHRDELVLAHKHQEELELRLGRIMTSADPSAAGLVDLQQQLAASQYDLGMAATELRELEGFYLAAREASVWAIAWEDVSLQP